MKKKLTYRQQQFLSQFLDIYHETESALHYGTVAEHLGIGKVTAYEMLRLLEEHDLVKAEYQPNPDQHGPGRSTVLFYPTSQAQALLNRLAGKSGDYDDWHIEKEKILRKLREGQAGGYEELLSSLLLRIPERRNPLIFVTELITSVILTLVTMENTPEIQQILHRLSRIGLPQEVGLSVLSGISMFLSVLEKTNRRSSTILLNYLHTYENTLTQLSEESKQQLAEYTREVVNILSS